MPAGEKNSNPRRNNRCTHIAKQGQIKKYIKYKRSNKALTNMLHLNTTICQDTKHSPTYKQLPITKFMKAKVKVKEIKYAINRKKNIMKLDLNTYQNGMTNRGIKKGRSKVNSTLSNLVNIGIQCHLKLSKMIRNIGEELGNQSERRLNWENQILQHHSKILSMYSEIFSIIRCTICCETSTSSSGMLKLMHCSRNHPVCAECLNSMADDQKKCPLCREKIIGRANSLEKIAAILGRRQAITDISQEKKQEKDDL